MNKSPRVRKLFRIEEDTVHNSSGGGNFFLVLFKIHASNLKPPPHHKYLLVYFGSKATASQIRALGKTRQMIYKKKTHFSVILYGLNVSFFCAENRWYNSESKALIIQFKQSHCRLTIVAQTITLCN